MFDQSFLLPVDGKYQYCTNKHMTPAARCIGSTRLNHKQNYKKHHTQGIIIENEKWDKTDYTSKTK